MSPPAVCYVRSSPRENQTMLGPTAQREAMSRFAHAQGFAVVATFEDIDVSGADAIEDRPGLLAAIDTLKAHKAGVLLAAKRDRFARDVVLSALLRRLVERMGAKVMTADGVGNGDTPEDQLMGSIVDAFAAYERLIIKARTKAALAVKKQRGERTGNIPFGSRVAPDGKTLEPDAREQSVIDTVQTLRKTGATYATIADKLNGSGWKARGEKFYPSTIGRILKA